MLIILPFSREKSCSVIYATLTHAIGHFPSGAVIFVTCMSFQNKIEISIVDHLSSRFAEWGSLPFLQKQQIDARESTFNDIGRDQHNHFYIFADQDPSTNADHQKMDVGDVAANKGTGVSFVLY